MEGVLEAPPLSSPSPTPSSLSHTQAETPGTGALNIHQSVATHSGFSEL